MAPRNRPPRHLPEHVLQHPEVVRACAERDLGRLFRVIGNLTVEPARFTATHIGVQCQMSTTRVQDYIRGTHSKPSLPTLERVADGLHIPGHYLGLTPRPWEAAGKQELALAVSAAPEVDVRSALTEIQRRTFLASGLALSSIPALNFDELTHLVAALDNARRYLDSTVVDYFRRQIANYAIDDGAQGPRHTLPAVLGLIGAIETKSREVNPTVRRELVAVGARGAEFAGWLYRDIGLPHTAGLWRDRATEWAQEAGDWTMQGYILLKKSQAAWDERDGLRMLTLAQAVQDGPWRLPAQVRAEAAQQEARGHAMLRSGLDQVERKLDEAQAILNGGATADDSDPAISVHYDPPLMAMQTAICYCEAGEPRRAVGIYRQHLKEEAFSRRDYGYFLSLMGSALTAAGEPDEASDVALRALPFAVATDSARTLREITLLSDRLEPWADRSSVRYLRAALRMRSTGTTPGSSASR